MLDIKVSDIKNKCISIIGTAKNAGKTTVMNALLETVYNYGLQPAITSIGRDGEKIDVVTETAKPEIFVREGTLVASASKLLEQSGFTRELVLPTGYSTPLGNVYVARALSGGFAQIGGPSMVSQLETLKEKFFELGADTVLIDGAAGRKSLGTAEMADGVILASGAGYSRSLAETLKNTVFLASLFSLPIMECDFGDDFFGTFSITESGKSPLAGIKGAETYRCRDGYIIYYPGAVLDSSLNELVISINKVRRNGEAGEITIVFDDPSKILFGKASYDVLMRCGVKTALRSRPELLAVAVNPYSPYGWKYDKDEFKENLQKMTDFPVINVRD